MRRTPKCFLWILALTALLAVGCGVRDKGISAPESAQEGETEALTGSPDVAQGAGVDVWDKPGEETSVPKAAEGDFFYYGYETLQTEEERQLYGQILTSLSECRQETILPTVEDTLLDRIFQRVMADHPEIFYVDGYSATAYKMAGTVVKLSFSASYTMEQEEIERRKPLLSAAVSRWLSGMDPGAGDYEKVKFLYEYLILHTDYDMDSEDSQNICSPLLGGRSVCQGYAKTLQYLCQQAGIPAMLVTGTVRGQGHAWDLLLLDGDWYYVDPTWGDASYRQAEKEAYAQDSFPAVNYDYFCVTTEQIERSHSIGSGQQLPECTAVEDQYYRREGLYLEKADLDAVGEIFERAGQTGERVVMFQCADDAVYQELYRLLITEQKIFDYLPEQDHSTTFSDSDAQRTFTFWL